MRVVYFLLTHQQSPQIPRLLARLRSGGDALVLVHHDAKAAPLLLPRHDDLHILSDPIEVRWGELSQVEATLRGIDWLRRERIAFDWLLTLSGQDALAQPLARTEATLAAARHDGFVSHVPISGSRRQNPTPWQQSQPRQPSNQPHGGMRHITAQYREWVTPPSRSRRRGGCTRRFATLSLTDRADMSMLRYDFVAHPATKQHLACFYEEDFLDFHKDSHMSSVLKKRRKKMRKHKYKKLRRRQKFLRRKS